MGNSAVTTLDDALEHLVIVPREARYGSDPVRCWADVMRSNRERYEAIFAGVSAEVRGQHCLVGFLTSQHLVRNGAVRALAWERIRVEGVTTDAERFRNDILEVVSDKVRVIARAMRHLGLTPLHVGAHVIDVRHGTLEMLDIWPE